MLALHQADNGRMASQSAQSSNSPGDDESINAELNIGVQGYPNSVSLLTSTLLESETFQALQQPQQQQTISAQPQPLLHQEQELLLHAHLQHIQQAPPQYPFAHSLHPLQSPEKAHSPTSTSSATSWAFDYPPLPSRGNHSSSTQGPGLLTRSLNPLHPLQQTPPQTLTRSHGQAFANHQQQQQQQALSTVHGPLVSSFSMNFPSTSNNVNQPSIGMLGQQDTSAVIPDMVSWSDQGMNVSKTDIFQLTSPPMTPSGIAARSPNSYGGTPLVYGQHHKRPPLWPMDRAPLLPLPRQTLTPQQSSKAANLQYVPCKFFKSGACTAGKNCLFSHSRDIHSENHVCKYFLKGNCKFGSKCSLSHSFLSADRKSSAMNLNSSNNSTSNSNLGSSTVNGNQSGRVRLERRASSGAIASNFWPTEPLSPPFGPPLNNQGKSALQTPISQGQHPLRLDRSASQEFSINRSPSQPALYSRNMLTRPTIDNFRQSYSLNGALKHAHDMASSPSMDDTGSSPESNSLASTFGSGSFDLGMASVNGSLGTFENRARQHLAAPLPIRQRSLPDIFRLGPCSGSYTSTSSGDLGGLAVGSAGAAQMPSSSPFYPTGSKALFLGVTFDYDGTQSSPVKLHSIPERSHQQPGAAQPGQNQLQQQQQQLHQQCTTERGINNYNSSLGNNTAFLSTNEVALGDFGSDEEGDLKTDLGYLPSSLSELLNSGNRQSQQEAEESTTGVHSTNVLPSPASTLREEKDEEIGSHDRSISSATTLGTNRDPLEAFRNRFQSSTDDFQRDTRHDQPAQNRATQNDRQFSVYTDIDDASFFSHTVYDISRDGSKSSSSTSFHPLSSQFNGLLYDDYGRIDQTPFHQHQSHFPEGSETYNLKDTFPLEATNSTSRSGTPDPFCPFRQEADEVQFAMDDDLPVATSGPTDSICSNPLGLGLYGEPPVSPSQLHLSSPTLASYASALQSPTSRHLGDLDKPTKHEELGEPLSDKQDLHDNLVALMNSLDIAKTGANSV